MTAAEIFDRIKLKHIVAFSILVVITNVLINKLTASEDTLRLFNAAFEVIMSVSISIFVLILYLVAHKKRYAFSRTILWLNITMWWWAIGDSLYVYLTYVKIDPFISIVDISYILAYLFLIIAALTIPGSQPPSYRRNMVFIEISILVLSAAVIFFILLLAPGKPNLNFEPFTLLMVFIYPLLDIILIWVLMVLFFTYSLKSTRKVLTLLLSAAFCISISDFFYLFNNLYGALIDDYLVDLGYYFFYILLLLAGYAGFKEIRERAGDQGVAGVFKQNNWIAFLPGVFLILLIGLLLAFVLNQSFILFHGVVFLIVLIIILFIIHQYLVIADNIKLSREMKQVNAQLESKVEIRTLELSKANLELQEEMKERENAEKHLAKSNRDLALLNKDKDKLFSILAHDLRSPLGSVMKLSELLIENSKDFDEKEILEVMEIINRASSQTFQLLNDLLAWSAVQMGRGETGKTEFQVSEVVIESIGIIDPEATQKHISILSEIDPDLHVFADKFAIQTVLRNLISNAIKFTQHYGEISVKAQMDAGLVRISVSDNGSGMTKEMQKKLFRVDAVNSTPGTDGEKGSGFGLLLCKDLIERNGGTIWLESDKGKGSTFHFTLNVYSGEETGNLVNLEKPTAWIEYAVDDSNRLGFTTLVGVFNLPLLRSELNLLWKRDDFNPNYSVLIDLRSASFTFDMKEHPELISVFTDFPGNKLNRKFALLTETPQQVAYSSMLGQFLQSRFSFKVEVFSTYEAAINWLGGASRN
jgi:signal transduction histidine kinase